MTQPAHTLSPFVSVRNADALIASYQEILGGSVTVREPESGTVARAEVQIGDSIIRITEMLPQGSYVLYMTTDIHALETKINDHKDSGWTVTAPPKGPLDNFLVMHATDPAGVTWIIQQPVQQA